MCDFCPQPSTEAYFTEILLCKNELNDTLNNLCRWMKDEHVDKNLVREKLWAELGVNKVGGIAGDVTEMVAFLAGDTAGLGLHPQGPVRGRTYHRALELPHPPLPGAPHRGHCSW